MNRRVVVAVAAAASAAVAAAIGPAGGTLAAAPTGSSCTTRPDTTGAIDYVVFGHGQYEATGELLTPVPMPSSTPFPGPQLGIVRRMLGTDPPGFGPVPYRDGDATCLPVGTSLHSYFGDPVTARIVARTGIGYKVYEPATNGTGADLISLRHKLTSVEILDGPLGTVTGRIADATAVRRFAEQVEMAPLGAAPIGTARVVRLSGAYDEWIWYPDRSQLGRIILPTEINDMLRAAAR